MKEGVAIVTTECDGIPEDLTHNETGILVQPGNSLELANAIETLLKDEDLRRKLARNAKQHYEERFGFEKMKRGIQSLLDEMFL